MDTNHTIPKDSELSKAGKELIAAAYRFWQIHQREAGGGAVVWLEDDSGHFVLFTRGEYKDAILSSAIRETRSETYMFEPFTTS